MFENVTLDRRAHRTNKRLSQLLGVLAKGIFGAAGFAFFFCGGLIHAVANVDRLFAEMIGLGLTVVLAALGAIAVSASENLAPYEEDSNSNSQKRNQNGKDLSRSRC